MKKAFAGKVNFNMGFFYLLFSMGIVYTISSPVIIEIGERIGRDISDTGLMFSFYFIGFIGGSLLNNLLTKYFNRKKLVLFFTFLVTISTFSVFFIFNYPFLLFTFFMIGISVGFIEAQASVLMIEVNRENEGLFMNLSQVFFGLGAFIGPLLPVGLMRISADWKYIYMIASIMCLSGFIYIATVKFPVQDKRPAPGFFGKKDMSYDFKIEKKPVFLFLVMAMFFYVCSETGLAVWIPTFLRMDKFFDTVLAGQVLSFFWLATFAGRAMTGFLTKKIKVVTILIISAALATLFLIAGIFLKSELLIIISFILAGLFLSGLWPLIVTLGGMEYQSRKDFVISIILVSGGIGGLSAPWLFKLILDRFNLFIAFNANYIFLLFLILVISGIYFYKKRNPDLNPGK